MTICTEPQSLRRTVIKFDTPPPVPECARHRRLPDGALPAAIFTSYNMPALGAVGVVGDTCTGTLDLHVANDMDVDLL